MASPGTSPRPRGAGAARGRSDRYERARFEWNDRYASLARGKRNWQLAALALLAVDVGLAAGLVHLALASRIVPYVVEVDALGQAVAFGPAEKLRDPEERLLRYQLGLFIHHARTVTPDPAAQRYFLNRAYDYVSGDARAFLDAHYRRENPFERALRGRVRVEVQSLLPLGGELWQVAWNETRENLQGRLAEERRWQAVLSVEIDPPRDTSTLLANPLGLYVTEITWTRTL